MECSKNIQFSGPRYALHAPIIENKRKRGFKKQGKDPSSKGLPSYDRGKGKGRQGSFPFHIVSSADSSEVRLRFSYGHSVSNLSGKNDPFFVNK